ncbi:nascent polypeptide-associated complex protein [Candidatus Pacearchaeota archaeon CG10_big_fil_rev_8_21_14_0_10_34_76]|nr:MAG: nascent polypeptide-associated complex protein [Candidatus Pacearchaeota archaeon CG10_big_fil_rev_8_21_14_0_10_34_76]
MIPGLGGMNPKKMASMMKQLGINQEEIEATRVVIEREDGNIVIENPSVVKIIAQGNEMWQISGDAREEETGFSDEDINLVMEKTGKSKEQAALALEETGDIAEAIVKLSE